MKVLIVNDRAPCLDGSGGAETHVRQLKKALEEQPGITVAILAGRHEGEPELVEEDRFLIPNLDLPPLRKHALKNRRKQQAALARAETLIRGFGPDVIHVHNFINPAVLRMLRRYGPAVKSLHDVRPLCIKPPPITASRLIRNTERLCTGNCGLHCFFRCYALAGDTLTDRMASWAQFPANMQSRREVLKYQQIVTYGSYLRDFAARVHPAPERIHVVPHFTDAERASAGVEIRPLDETVFLFAGRLSYEKGLLHIFRALEQIPDIPCRVIIAGDGPLRDEVAQRARSVSPQHRIELPGFVRQEALYDLYRRSSVLLFPSIGAEGCGLVGPESMYFGNTAIGYDTGGAGEWLIDGVTGIRVERCDVDGLARAMARLATHPDERLALRVRAREFVRQKFRREAHVSDLIEIYEKTIQDWQEDA